LPLAFFNFLFYCGKKGFRNPGKMRKALFLVLVIEVIFLIGIFSPPAFSKDFPRHKDPAEIQEESFLPAQLISLYGVAVSLQIAGKWDEA